MLYDADPFELILDEILVNCIEKISHCVLMESKINSELTTK